MRTIIIFTLCFVLGISHVLAQESGKLRAVLEVGCLFAADYFGPGFFSGFLCAIEWRKMEIRYKIN